MTTVATDRPKAKRRWLGLLGRNRDFARLWLGETVSAWGSQVTALALPLVAVELLDANAGQMGLLGAAQTVPFLVFSLLAGVWVDRTRRRPILVVANAGRALFLGLIPVLAAVGVLQMGHLLAIAFAVGSCAVFFELAYQSYLPRVVDHDELVEANSSVTASSSVAEVGGPGLAGILVGVLTAPFAIAFDAVSFLASAINLAGIRRPEPDNAVSADDAGLREAIGVGFRATFHNRYLLAFAGEAATYNVAWNAINAILVLWAVRELGLGAGTLGLLLSVGSVGALLGALLTARVARWLGVGRAMWMSAVVSNLGVLLLPLAGGERVAMLGVLGLGFFLRGLGATGTNVHTYAIRQVITPDRLMGRTNAVYRLLTYGFVPLGALLGGWLGDTLGLRSALWVGAIALFPSWLWLFFSPARSLQVLPTSADPPRDAGERADERASSEL